MRFRMGMTAAATSVLMFFGLTAVIAPPAVAASACSGVDTPWDLEETVRDGKYVIKNYSARYYTCSKVVVRRTDGKRINVSLRIRRDFTNPDKQDTTKTVQILDRKRVTKYFMTDNVWIDVSVWAGLASKDTMPYRGTTTLQRT
jgi:hypothetical protein